MNIEDTFCEFVAIDSPTGTEQAFSDYLKARLMGIGWDAYQDERGNLVVQTQGTGEPLLLAAHMDTVEPGRGIKPSITDGIVHSDGSTILGADNKVAVALFFELLRWVATERPATLPLDVVFSVSEETGVSGAHTLDLAQVRAKRGMTVDSSRPVGSIVLSAPSYVALELTLQGTMAHASRSEQGVSVVPALAAFLASLGERPIQDPDFTFNLGTLQAGSGLNSLMSSATLGAELRSFVPEKLAPAQEELAERLRQAAEDNGCTATFTAIPGNTGYAFTQDNPYIQEIVGALNASLPEREVNFVPRNRGLSDANVLNERGIHTVNLGNGSSKPHTTQEQASVQDMRDLLTFLKELVTKKDPA
jgi:tripeptide aminopeptidase